MVRALADEIVEHALAPLVYSPGPAEDADPADWKLRPAAELLDLKVCDPAVGSGAILVAACRYLADRLVEAWTAENAPDAEGDPDEVLVTARRAVADRCLYGVDRDPMAVEMARLSLWLVTLSKERPFSFLDHALKAGDSLLGITDLDQLRALHLDPAVGRGKVGLSLKPDAVDEAVASAIDLRRRLESIPVLTVRDAEEKARVNAEAEAALHTLRTVADLVVGCTLRSELPGQPPPEDQIAASAPLIAVALDADEPDELRASALAQVESRARQALDAGRPEVAPRRHPLHWPLAFPEVFVDQERPGFDAMVGNPPFLGGTRISRPMGDDFRQFLATQIAQRATGRADLVAFFVVRAAHVSRGFGFLATDSVRQGDSRDLVESVLDDGWVVYRAVSSRPWPGSTALTVAEVWARYGWQGGSVLDGSAVAGISAALTARARVEGAPATLVENIDRCFKGSDLCAKGFILKDDEARDLAMHAPARRFMKPLMNGDDLNSRPLPSGCRTVIDASGVSIATLVAESPPIARLLENRVRPEVEAKAKSYKGWSKRWWQYWRPRAELYDAIARMEQVLVITRHSQTIMPAFTPKDQVFTDALNVFAYDDYFHFAVLSSAPHWWWVVTNGSSLGHAPRYTTTDCFETFPQPPYDAAVEAAGKALDEHRGPLMIRNDEGLTKTYNRVHNPDDESPGIPDLRDLHVALDVAIRDAYGWSDLDLDHRFHDTPQGLRFTLGSTARTEVLDRLLELNHQRYAEEVAAGLHDTKKKGGRKKGFPDAPTLL